MYNSFTNEFEDIFSQRKRYFVVDIIDDEYILTGIRFNRPLERAD